MIEIDREITQDYERALGLEWLETNGLGGWAGTTVAGAHSRRDHGLLVAATEPPAGRTVLLSRLDETLHVEGESFELSCNQFPGAVAPRGFEHLTAFRQDLFPTFEFEAGGVRLRKTVAAVDGENTTLVLYEVVEAPGPVHPVAAPLPRRPRPARPDLRQPGDLPGDALRGRHPAAPPLFGRARDLPPGAGRGFPRQSAVVVPLRVRGGPPAGARVPGGSLDPRRLRPRADRRRPPRRRDLHPGPGRTRRLRPVREGAQAAGEDRQGACLAVQDDFARSLALAADSFLVRRGASQRAVIAGYPGSEERSRDALIALPGLCLVTGRHEDAKKILRAFVKSLHQGLLPDRCPARTRRRAHLGRRLALALRRLLEVSCKRGDRRRGVRPRDPPPRPAQGRPLVRQGDPPGDQDGGRRRSLAGPRARESTLSGSTPSRSSPISRRGSAIRTEAKRLAQRAKRAPEELPGGVLTRASPRSRSRSSPSASPSRCCRSRRRRGLLAAIAEALYAPAGLLGPYLTALVRVHGAAGRKKGLAAIEALKPRLAEAGSALSKARRAPGAWPRCCGRMWRICGAGRRVEKKSRKSGRRRSEEASCRSGASCPSKPHPRSLSTSGEGGPGWSDGACRVRCAHHQRFRCAQRTLRVSIRRSPSPRSGEGARG